jgi:hypothetical protein
MCPCDECPQFLDCYKSSTCKVLKKYLENPIVWKEGYKKLKEEQDELIEVQDSKRD